MLMFRVFHDVLTICFFFSMMIVRIESRLQARFVGAPAQVLLYVVMVDILGALILGPVAVQRDW